MVPGSLATRTHPNKKWAISIEWQELFPIYLACVLWGPTWSGKRILMWCDNQSVVAIINSKHSKSPRIMDLVCSITLLTLTNNFTISATHIPGLDNAIADNLSRWTVFGPWLPQPPSLLVSSPHQQCSSDSLSTAILPCLSRPLHKANLPGRSKTFFNL